MNKKEILEYVSRKSYRPSKFKEIARSLRIAPSKKREFRNLIRELLDDGSLVQLPGRKLALSNEQDLLEGILTIKGAGYGFVDIAGDCPLSVYIPERCMKRGYLPNDRVLVQIDQQGYDERLSGRIVKVIAHNEKPVAGIFRSRKGQNWAVVEYIDNDIDLNILVPKPTEIQDYDNKVVLVQIIDQHSPEAEPRGIVENVLGDVADPATDIQWIHHRFDLPFTFSKPATKELAEIPSTVEAHEIDGRVDLRSKPFVTIDPDDARDFDDAVALEPADSETPGSWRLFVSIADVSHYVKTDSAIHDEALSRANSTYFADYHIPMLPLPLAADLCSLKEGKDRLTITAEILLDRHLAIRDSKIYPSVIRSAKRLTFDQVYKWLASNRTPRIKQGKTLIEALRSMHVVSQKLRERRFSRGALNLDIPESRFHIDSSGHVTDVVVKHAHVVHHLIEEFMILANEVVAQVLSDKRTALLYRIHEEPDEAKAYQLNRLLTAFSLPNLQDIRDPKELNRLTALISTHPIGKQLNIQLLRCLKQARYSPHNIGHFGLASPNYAHFTSPIRRFSDLIVHRILRAVLFEKRNADEIPSIDDLQKIGNHLSKRERDTMEAEREYEKMKKCRFMMRYVGRRMSGTIISITAFGIFVELNDYPIEGLLRLSDLRDDYYRFYEDSQKLIGSRHRRQFTLGQKLNVFVTEVDIFRRHIRFILAGESR